MMIENTMLDGALVSKLRAEIDDLFQVNSVEIPRQLSLAEASPIPGLGRLTQQRGRSEVSTQGVVIFVGDLLMQDSEAAYDLIAERWQAHDYTPLLRRHKGQIALIGQPGVVVPKPSNPWINFWLAVATILAVLLTGANYECQCYPTALEEWLLGIPMMLTIMAVLLAHEFGHYFAARYHKVAVTLPYFLPLPFLMVGTLGAFIQLRSPFKTKKELFDIGVAGPLAGLVFAIPLIFWSIARLEVGPAVRGPFNTLEGNSIFYLLVKFLMHGELLPSFVAYSDLGFLQEYSRLLIGIIPPGSGTDISLDTVALAAWFSLVVTAMNLIPVGQLDGGHVIYCLLGDKARPLGLGLIGVMVLAGIFLWPGWLLWAGLVFFIIGPGHPPPLNDLIELDSTRKTLAYVMIVIFVILFMPNPLQQFV